MAVKMYSNSETQAMNIYNRFVLKSEVAVIANLSVICYNKSLNSIIGSYNISI